MDSLVVVLNKVDLLPEATRTATLDKVPAHTKAQDLARSRRLRIDRTMAYTERWYLHSWKPRYVACSRRRPSSETLPWCAWPRRLELGMHTRRVEHRTPFARGYRYQCVRDDAPETMRLRCSSMACLVCCRSASLNRQGVAMGRSCLRSTTASRSRARAPSSLARCYRARFKSIKYARTLLAPSTNDRIERNTHSHSL